MRREGGRDGLDGEGERRPASLCNHRTHTHTKKRKDKKQPQRLFLLTPCYPPGQNDETTKKKKSTRQKEKQAVGWMPYFDSPEKSASRRTTMDANIGACCSYLLFCCFLLRLLGIDCSGLFAPCRYVGRSLSLISLKRSDPNLE